MKVAKDLTCKAIFYYSLTGNTKAIVEEIDASGLDIYNMAEMKIEDINFNYYETILIGTSTIGDGEPHSIFKKLSPKLSSLKGKEIGLFGSGNSIYRKYCGALDMLDDFLSEENDILFKYKFESYPTDYTKEEFQKIINKIKRGNYL